MMKQISKEPKVTIKIPRPLYNRIQELIAGAGFNSATDFIVYVLRDLVTLKRGPEDAVESLTHEEIVRIRERLQGLGYL